MLKDLIFAEYNKIKDEQIARISYRDNMIYVNLAVLGSILSYGLSNVLNINALLVAPWSCLILGWLYLVNDEKVSAIGRYIRHDLTSIINKEFDIEDKYIFNWEITHRTDKRRVLRKINQLIIDEITFPISGIFTVIVYCHLARPTAVALIVFIIAETLSLIYLGTRIYAYADIKKGR